MSEAPEQQGRRKNSYYPVVKIISKIDSGQAGAKGTDEIEVAGAITTSLTINSMKQQTAELLRLRPIREEVVEQASDGSQKILRIVRLQGFRLGGKARNLGIGDLDADFCVVQNESMLREIAFGTDFLRKHGAVLDFENGTITLASRKWDMYPMDR